MNHQDPFSPELQGKRVANVTHNVSSSDISYVPQAQDGASVLTVNTEKNMRGLVLFFALVLTVLCVRLIYLQIVHGSDYRLRSDGNRVRTSTVPAPRGAILDRHGVVIAENVPNIILTVIPADLPKQVEARSVIFQRLSTATEISITAIEDLLKAKQRRSTDPISILENIPYDRAMKMIISLADLPAVSIVSIPNRNYPTGTVLASVLGYTGKISPEDLLQQPNRNPQDIIGRVGLEKQYDLELTGVDGMKSVERDVQNREQRVISQRDAQPGNSLVTTIDSELQRRLSKRLNEAVKSVKSPGGAAIAIDPRNGEILALANEPTYDNNWFVQSGHGPDITLALTSPSKPLLNRAISGQYPSGSIVKPLISAAALAEKNITSSTTVMSVGGFKVGNDFFPDWKAGGHGATNVTKAIAESVNTFFYAVGGGLDKISGLGVDRIVQYLQKFGWGSTLGIDLPSEAAGLLPTKEWRTNQRASPWKLGDTYHLAIGQGDLEVTPLQIASSISAVANGGTLYRPHLVKEIRRTDGQVKMTKDAEIVTSQVVSASVISTVRSGMRQGVVSGSSRSLQSLPVTSGAKTGTAQFGNDNKTHAWFTVFAPFDNPQIAITVLVEAGGEGNATALPVAKDILQWYFTEGAGKTT